MTPDSKPDPVALSHVVAFGRVWVACQHGAEWQSVAPTRLCLDCFRQLIAGVLLKEKDDDEA